jgi:hypothetical protein
LVDALGAVAVDAHHFRGATRRHFQREVADQPVELAVSQLTVFNQSLGHSNSLFLDCCSIQAPWRIQKDYEKRRTIQKEKLGDVPGMLKPIEFVNGIRFTKRLYRIS